MTKQKDRVKTTLMFDSALWLKTRHRALDEDLSAQELVAVALTEYLKTPLKPKAKKEVQP